MLPGLPGLAPEARQPGCADALPIGGRGTTVVRLEGVVMILDLHRQGLTVTEISRRSGLDRKTVSRYIERGLEPPTYGPRQPRPTLLDPFNGYLRERVHALFPG